MANRAGRRERAISEQRAAERGGSARGGSVRGPLLASLVVAAASAGAAYAYGPQPAPKKSTTTVRTAAAAETCTASGTSPKRQLRGVWIATVHNSNWPSRTGLTPARQRAEYVEILDNAVKRRLNAVFVQVRPASDAIYASTLEPWSQFLTGTPGKDPGWDPLPFLISEAHKRGLEFQAWFNPYRAAYTTDVSALPAGHPARVHPEWTVKHEGRLYYNPGLPEVRAWVAKVVTDVVRRYDVDGVHFDDYFYPYPGNGTRFADAAAFAKYGKGAKLADWRRDNVNKLVAQVSGAVHGTKPYVKFGISPFGIWRNKSNDPKGSDTNGMSAYDAIYADAKAWIRAGSVDYLIPQLYWPRGFSAADYDALVPWWAEAVRGSDVDLYIGQALYRVGTKDTPAWTKPAEMPSHLTVNRRYPEVKGDVYFSASGLAANPLGVLDRIAKNHYTRPALLPVIKGLPAAVPAVPAGLKNTAGNLTWTAAPQARAYGVYRVTGENGDCATVDARHLVAVVPADDRPAYTAKESGEYYVTALDRLNNESAPARVTVALP